MNAAELRIGTAGWAIPSSVSEEFRGAGSHLERYAARLNAAEINSSFHRSHRPSTYERWRSAVPDGFLFAVKMPKEITHVRRLDACGELVSAFLAETAALGERRGPLLIQLPPSFAFEPSTAGPFFQSLRDRYEGKAACEPRHASWFCAEADRVLSEARIARVAADPARVPGAEHPGGWPGFVYYRLHGSPRIYHSAYPAEYLQNVAAGLAASAACGVPTWCIFDNTASGAAAANALHTLDFLGR